MSIFNLIPSQNLRRALKDSGTLQAKNSSSIASGATINIPLSEKWDYDECLIVNLNSDNDATITINGSIKNPLPKGTTTNLSNQSVKTIQITNNGSTTINANEIEVYYQHTGRKELNQLNTYANTGSFVLNLFGAIRK